MRCGGTFTHDEILAVGIDSAGAERVAGRGVWRWRKRCRSGRLRSPTGHAGASGRTDER